MSSTDFNPAALVEAQLQKALSAATEQPNVLPSGEPATAPDPAPVAATPAPVANSPAAVPAPVDDRYEKLMAAFEAQQKEFAALKKALPKPAPETPAPARTTVKSVEQQVADLNQRLIDAEDLRAVERDLPNTPEYAILKSVPDLARTVLNTIREEQRTARESGEGERKVTVAQATAKIKQAYIASLKNHLQNQDLAREIGFSAPAPTAPASSGRALTSDLATSGSTRQTTSAPSLDQLLKLQVEKAIRSAGG